MNVIASLGLKVQDLYKVSFQDYLKQNPELKKLSKELQNQRYVLYEEERQNNINRCIEKRKEIISITKKSKKRASKNNKNLENLENEELNSDNNKLNELGQSGKLSSNMYRSGNSYRPKLNTKDILFSEKNKKILMTENSYVMNSNDGNKALITREDLDNITCLKKEKSKLEKKMEQKDDYLMRLLKGELTREKKIQKVKKKINEKEKKLKKFLKDKNENIKIIENERYQYKQDVFERQKLYEKMMANYEKKIVMTKKQQQELSKNKALNKEKIDELKEQINEYEKKNEEIKQKISDMFDLKDKDRELKEKKFDVDKPDLGKRKLVDLEEKLELERFRRENALMTNLNNFQDKINNILEKKEEKEKKIKKTIQAQEKRREEKRVLQSIHYEEVRNKVRDKQKKMEEKRNLKLQDLEKKDLKTFAIKQEKIKMFEERKKINQQNYENRKAMKEKLQEILKEQQNMENEQNEENIINRLING